MAGCRMRAFRSGASGVSKDKRGDMRSLVVAATLTAGITTVAARQAEACSCAFNPTPCQAFDAPVIFVGEVQSVQEVDGEFHMRLRVTRALKGIDGAVAEVRSDARSSCGVKLTEGERYVIYTSRGTDGRMSIHACSSTIRLRPGEPEPELPPVPGRVYGRVTRYDMERIRRFAGLDPIPAVRVSLDLPTGQVTAVSDAWGRFTFRDVPPGTYDVGVDAGQGLQPWMARPVRLEGPKDCASASIVLHPSGLLSGHVVGAGGEPARGVYVLLLHAAAPDSVVTGNTTDAEGRFAFDGIEAGDYLLAVNPTGHASGRQPYAATYFGGRDAAAATRIGVALGSPTRMADPLVLPPPLPTRTVTVSATCRDGSTPPALLAMAIEADTSHVVEYSSDRDGLDSLLLLRDKAYRIKVSVYLPQGPAAKGTRRKEDLPAFEVPAGVPGRHVALVAPFTGCAERRF